MDEPTAGVSPKMKEDVLNKIKLLQGKNKTILIIEHDLNFITNLCSRVIVLNQGSVLMEGTPAEVRASEAVKNIYL